MKYFFELLTDKRFSLKFRILNILSGDYLRNYLAVGVAIYINDCVRILNDTDYSEKSKLAMVKYYTTKAKKAMEDVWYI